MTSVILGLVGTACLGVFAFVLRTLGVESQRNKNLKDSLERAEKGAKIYEEEKRKKATKDYNNNIIDWNSNSR